MLIPLSLAAAEIGFRIVHPDGSIEFTDDPLRGGEPIELHLAPTIPAHIPTPARAPRSSENAVNTTYQQFQITSPEMEQVIWFDGSGVNVNISLQPGLQPQHLIAIEMNGKRVAEGIGSSFNIPLVYRGSHTLRAMVMDLQGRVIKSTDPVSFHMRQHSTRN